MKPSCPRLRHLKIRPHALLGEAFLDGGFGSIKAACPVATLHLRQKDFQQRFVVVVFEEERFLELKTPTHSRVCIAQEIFHSLFVAKKQNASIVSWNPLHLCDDRVNDSEFIRILSTLL